MSGSSLALSPSTEQRILAAAKVLRISPDAFLQRLLSQHYNTLGGLPIDLLRYILSFLDYSTISGLASRVSKFWQECVLESPQNFFSHLRQTHGIHLLDPAHGMFYFPRALKRVMFDAKGNGAGGAAGGRRPSAMPHRTFAPDPAALRSNAQAVPASSFLTVDIRTQNTKTLPWGYVQMTVRRAIERERAEFGAVRTPGLQRPEDPVWSQAATVAYDRRIYMFGGETYEGVVLGRAYEYDPTTKHWAVLPDLSEKRAAASAVAFQGRIFVFGGYNEEGKVLDTYEVLDVPTRSWVSRHYPPSWLYSTPSPHTCTHPADATKAMVSSPTSAPTAAATATKTATGAFFRNLSDVVSGVPCAVSSQYRMPEKVCGTATTVYGDIIIFTGGHQSCIAPDQTAVSYSAMNSASTTPMHSIGDPLGGGAFGSQSVAGTPSTGFGGLSSHNGSEFSGRSAHGGGIGNFTSAHNGISGGDPMSTTASTPLSMGFDSLISFTAAGGINNGAVNANVNASAPTNSPPRLPRANSISFDGPATAETLVWIFSPITGHWWKDGPQLPSPRAFGALTVLELPVLGNCLCYFGGCAKADTPETAMFYIPLCDAQSTRLHRTQSNDEVTCDRTDDAQQRADRRSGRDGASDDSQGGPPCAAQPPGTADFLCGAHDLCLSPPRGASPQSPQRAIRGGGRGGNAVAATLVPASTVLPANHTHLEMAPVAPQHTTTATTQPSFPHTPTTPIGTSAAISSESVNTPTTTAQSSTKSTYASTVDMVARCFRDPEELPWQRYVRIPIGGAFTSVAVLGHLHSRTVVLTGFYPAANIGFCKVDSLLPPDAFTPLLGVLSLPSPPPAEEGRAEEAEARQSPIAQQPLLPGPLPRNLRHTSHMLPPRPLQLDVSLQNEAAAAANHYYQEREWSHNQRQEVRELVRSAALAATLRHPRNPQTAGEERRWSLAPVPEVRVRNPTGPALTRVSWKVQSINAKVIVGIE
ncbi:hypothetical protein ABL78_3954 [Leptomonas seymouri]|uniref:F-box domain-containing protein n=1 Tax=Leptomonas seymouri TaxID=5684 RepID=A0A0N1I440_LEPSE|nr:hypothetical protein ABL78_3954 [Leptomonas seymouri]|eukprot:KPI86963.1 hypothetical protein ABL78_3954 [Leptomonas seymouri]